MKDEIKSKLDAILDRHDAAKRAAAEAKRVAENKEQAFIREFLKICDTVIRPAMEEIGNSVSVRGISFRISNQDAIPSDPRRGGGQGPSIAITFFPGQQEYPEHDFPAFTVFGNKYKQNVTFHERTMMPGRGGSAGPSGEANLAELSSDLVQTKILNVLHKGFN
jgi:hypothetical protein